MLRCCLDRVSGFQKSGSLEGTSALFRTTLTKSFGVDVAGGSSLHTAQNSRVFDVSRAAFFGAEIRAAHSAALAAAYRTAHVGGFVPGETIPTRLGCGR